MAEHGRRHAAIIDLALVVAEHRVGKGMAFADRHRGQLQPVGHVAHRIDALATAAAILVDLDRALLVQLDARRLQPQPLGMGPPPGREQHQVGRHRIAIGEAHAQRPVAILLDLLHLRVEAEIDPLHHRNLEQSVAHRLVIAAQQRAAAIDHRHMAAELVEDAGELVGDVAAAHDHDATGAFVQMEHLVAGDAMFGALDLRDDRPGAGRHQDHLRADLSPARQLDAVRPGDRRPLRDQLDLVIFKRILVEPFQPVDIVQHIVAQRRPFKAAIGDVPAEAPGILQVLGEMRAIDEQLLGHAAANDAGAPDPKFLGHRDPGAMRRRHPRRPHAARSCTDDEKVEIIVAHAGLR